MDVSVTLRLNSREFDLVREAIEYRISNLHLAHGARGLSAREKKALYEKENEYKLLLTRMK